MTETNMLAAEVLVYSRDEVTCRGQQPGAALYWAVVRVAKAATGLR